MATFKFILRPSTKRGRHPGSISLRVIHRRKPMTMSICLHLFPEEWDERTQTVRCGGGDPAREKYLAEVQDKITASTYRLDGIIRKLEKKVSYTTGEVIANYCKTGNDNGYLLGYVETLVADLRENRQYRTAKAYETVCRGVVAFNRGEDIPLTHINNTLMKRFEAYLKENDRQPNTISYYMRNLRAIFNKAVEAGRIPKGGKSPFAGVYTGVDETRKRALSTEELIRLRNIDFNRLLEKYQPGSPGYRNILNLYFAWRLFFFCLFAHGMCFVDMAHLRKSHLREGVIRYYRKKTGKRIEVPVNEGMQKIIDSFADEMKDSKYLFPIAGDADGRTEHYEVAMRTQNRRLKKLAKLAGLNKIVSTHVARHSWATICKNELLPVSVISEGLGHSSEKMTRKYLDSLDHSILGDAGKTVLTAITRNARRRTITSN